MGRVFLSKVGQWGRPSGVTEGLQEQRGPGGKGGSGGKKETRRGSAKVMGSMEVRTGEGRCGTCREDPQEGAIGEVGGGITGGLCRGDKSSWGPQTEEVVHSQYQGNECLVSGVWG